MLFRTADILAKVIANFFMIFASGFFSFQAQAEFEHEKSGFKRLAKVLLPGGFIMALLVPVMLVVLYFVGLLILGIALVMFRGGMGMLGVI